MKKYVWDCEADDFTFGVEFELTYPISLEFDETFYEENDYGDIGPGFPSGWIRKHDSSIQYRYGRRPCEIVSPILQGKDGLKEAMEMARRLNSLGCKVNASCGFHVHVGFQDAIGTPAQSPLAVTEWLRRLLALVCFHENGILATTGSRNRVNNSYCRPNRIYWTNVMSWLKREPIYSLTKVNLFRETTRSIGRYLILNTTNIETRKKTVEFRVWSGTLAPAKVATYVQLALGFCQKAANEVNSGSIPWQAKYDPESRFYGPETSWVEEANRMLRALGWYRGGRQYGRLFPIEGSRRTKNGRIKLMEESDEFIQTVKKMARKIDSAGPIPTLRAERARED